MTYCSKLIRCPLHYSTFFHTVKQKLVVSTCVLPLVEFLFYIVSTDCRIDLKNQTTLPFECLHLCRSLTILLCGSHGNFISQISLRSIPSLIFLLYLTVKEHLQTQHFGTLCVLLFSYLYYFLYFNNDNP